MSNSTVDHPIALRKSDIAQLTNEDISRLNYDAMIEVVLASEMPVRNVERIQLFEGDTVVRLARMARDHCRTCHG